MHQGHLVADSVPEQCAAKLEAYEMDHNEALPIASAMPVAVRVWKACHYRDEAGSPVSIRQGKSWLSDRVRKTGQPGKGDVIKLMKRADGKFIEIGRENASSDALQFAPDETEPSLLDGEVFVTGENTKATAITDRKSTRLNSSHYQQSRMPSSA